MRPIRVAAFAALLSSVLPAQTPARQVANNGALEADLHYAAGSDTWVSTNKPAYVALFDLSRQRIAQMYPTFSAQAAYPISTEHRLVAVGQAGGAGGLFGGSSLYSNATWGGGVGAWPHTYLVIASTSPLQVGSPWSTNLDLNHRMIQKHIIDWQSDDAIETIIDMIHPLDPNAEMAYDRVDGIQPARQYLAADGFGANRQNGPTVVNCLAAPTGQSPLYGYLIPICAIPYPAPPTTPIVPAKKDTATSTTPAPPLNVNRKVASERHVITDPEEIRRFIESQTGHRSEATEVSRSGGMPADKQNAQNSTAADKSAANVNRQKTEGGAQVQPNTPRATNTDHQSFKPVHEQSSAPPPAPAPAPRAAPAPAPVATSAPAGKIAP